MIVAQIRADLPQESEDVNPSNALSSYFPIRTSDRKNKDIFDWDTVLGFTVKNAYRKHQELDVEAFKSGVEARFVGKLVGEKFWLVLDKMYFEREGFYNIAPEFLLFKANRKQGVTASSRLGDMYSSLMQDFLPTEKLNVSMNFLERELYEELKEQLKKQAGSKKSKSKKNEQVIGNNEYPYLPFLTKHFQQDLHFLEEHPKYLLSTFTDFLRLYAVLYTSQLALNLGSWRDGEPEPKRCYFILDSEKASEERTNVKDFGYGQLNRAMHSIFPYLAMNDSLQIPKERKQPIWKLAQQLQESPVFAEKLSNYAQAFNDYRGLDQQIVHTKDPLVALEQLLKLSKDEFGRGMSKHSINNEYVQTIQKELCSNFIYSRGRIGKVLVINQDYLMLLTNLVIGNQEKMRFHELVLAFESRGVFFDKQSHAALIEFYERIGNVEKMSDSGDAVYVRKTI
ncbi:DNA phosphorothioation-dependent restriction protein DptG [Vibrio breoganii]|uniref:DNA phosphorothioation-dependent restriction protein DptG n=1 Tax=Vibrio breoganii TaxID=553239 RepID=UPI000C845E13|nr:DNA phosphorothioation-dependent restriction protein DptG [Vibrio breoganii]PMK19974.1 DNA phosphorothioation-dependent restriction protein DptG [Vibrio breoganii]PMO31178.1 DNA phosphorothioation-dependent restriction protein DptG [Vibrio breoganii]PMO53360.1 DNA phosphorothioation-dependent restriction protein DptG [Vibrio breoganii]